MPVELIPSFNAGELSPRLESRPDLEKYGSGCRTLENFLIMPYGGVNRRPGLKYIGAAKYSNKTARLIGFNFSATTNFVLEVGDLYVRFWSNGAQVQVASAAYEITSPYLEAELFDLQYVQINDVMYITHPLHPVYKLSRLTDVNWTLASVTFDWPAMRDENITATTITPSATTGAGITLTASTAIFTSANVGSFYEITHRRASATVRKAITATGASSTLRVVGNWDFHTTGTWRATVTIERSYDSGTTWETISSFEGFSDRNISTTGDEEKECLLRVNVTAWTSQTAPAHAYLEASDSRVAGIVKITGFTSTTVVTGTVLNDLYAAAATALWSEGAWSDRRGHPRTVCMHEQRIFFGGNSEQAQTVWGSAVNDFETFRRLSYDDSAVIFTIASSETNAINWMVSQQILAIGTAGFEYIISATGTDAAITPTNIQIKVQSHFGSKYTRALLANEVVLFIQRQGRKLREFVYDFQKDGYLSADLTLLADHVTEGGIRQIAFMQQPDAILWVCTDTGLLAGMTYERGQNVVGWHRHATDGTFESVASIYGSNGSDEVWCLVNRSINGVTKRYVERMDPNYRETLEAETKASWFYVDSGATYTGAAATSITGLSHLTGEAVDILADGAVVASQVVVAGGITLATAASVVTAGLPYISTIKPMPLDPGPLPDGSAQGRKFRVARMVARIYKSLGGEVEVEDGVWDPIEYRDMADPMDSSPPPFTGDKPLTLARGFEDKATVQVRQAQPLPLTILALIPIYDVFGGSS